MNPYLIDAVEELKRVDHLVTVSLCYTRTVDVLMSIVKRMISTCDFIIGAILEEKIKSIPASPALKVEALQKNFKDNEELQDYLKFYTTLRKIARSEYTKHREYRRHVTMGSTLDDGTSIDVTMDLLKEYFQKLKDFLKFSKILIEGGSDEQ